MGFCYPPREPHCFVIELMTLAGGINKTSLVFEFIIPVVPCSLPESTTSGYFTVDPTLLLSEAESLPLDCISQQTVLSKCLGPMSQWRDRLRVGKESGYNMFHFTPIQKLGGSQSNYSLEDQLELNVSFSEPSGKKVTFDDVGKFIKQMRDDWKVRAGPPAKYTVMPSLL